MRKPDRREMEGMMKRGSLLIFMVIAVVFMWGCASTAPKSTASSSKQFPSISVTGDLTLMVSGFLPEPILQAGEARYRLEVTANSSLPPDMIYGNKIGWSEGRYHVEGYLSGKTTDVWNPTSRQLEKTPVLTVLRLKKSEKVQGDPCSDPNLTKIFPLWLKKGNPTDKQSGARHIIGETDNFLNLMGYKLMSHEPKLFVELGQDYLIYLSGRGTIVGRDGTKVLVGYECK